VKTLTHISLILGFWLLLPTVVNSQDFWEQLYFPDTTKIRCIEINNVGDIFTGTGNTSTIGGIYRSTDNAQSWECVYNLGDFSFLSIDISPQGDVFAGSNRGSSEKLLTTSNNGDTWQEIIMPEYTLGANVMKILAVSSDTLYVSLWGYSAQLIRTYDGGQTWDSLIGGNNHIGEYVSDIVIDDEGNIFVSYVGYTGDQGGIYYSEDDGETWQFSGLFNYMMTSLARNSSGDIFAGCWGGIISWDGSGLYVLRNGKSQWDTLIAGPQVGDLIVNNDNHIYFSSSWPDGVVRSTDDGNTFELVNSGIPNSPMGYMTIDYEGFIYVTSYYSSSFLAKTVNTTVFIKEQPSEKFSLKIFPNPFSDIIEIQLPKHKETNNYNNLPIDNINLFDINGKQMLNNSLEYFDGSYKINASKLKCGVYILEVQINNKTQCYKVMKN